MRTSIRRGGPHRVGVGLLGAGLVGVVLLLAGLVMVSARTGGPVSWHITAGSSMQPQIASGTLVVVARQASYAVGDVVAYPSEQLGQVVLHRVVRIDGDRLVLRGDANSWLDPDQPLQSEALGARVLQVPGVGAALGWLRPPAVLGAVGALSTLTLLGAGHRSRRRRRDGAAPGAPGPQVAAALRRVKAPAAVESCLAAGAAVCVLLAALATAGPLVSSVATPGTAQHAVAWSYTAQAQPGLVYDDGLAETGDTLYTRLVPAADVTARLRVDAPEHARVSGTWRLDVAVEDDNGWRRTTTTGAPSPVDARSAQLSVTVPVAELLELTRRAAEESGVASGQRRVSVRAVLDLAVAADGGVATTQATPALVFAADDAKVWLLDSTQLEQRAAMTVPAAPAARELRLAGVTLPAAPARLTAAAGAALSLGLLALLRSARRRETEDERIARTAGHLLVPMDNLAEPQLTVDVRSFAGLAAIAASYDRMVLFGDCAGLRVYLVLDDGVAYRYYCAATAARLDAAAPHADAPAVHAAAPPTGPAEQASDVPRQRAPEHATGRR